MAPPGVPSAVGRTGDGAWPRWKGTGERIQTHADLGLVSEPLTHAE